VGDSRDTVNHGRPLSENSEWRGTRVLPTGFFFLNGSKDAADAF
jgi:hypothetical protein